MDIVSPHCQQNRRDRVIAYLLIMATLLTVTGATGSQGQAVIKHFLKYGSKYSIRGLTRNTGSAKAKELKQLGVDMVTAEYDDVESLKKAFAGSDVIYAYTDFASLIETPAAKQILAANEASSLAHAARSIAIQQGKNIANAAATVSSLKRIIWSTTADTDTLSHRKYAGAYELENKAVVLRYLRSLPELKDKTNALYLSIFLNAILNYPWFFGFTKLAENAYAFDLPIRPEIKLPWTDLDVEAGRYVAALLDGPAGVDVEATTMHFSFDDLASLLKKSNVDVLVRQVSADQYVGKDTTGYALVGYNMLSFLAEYGAVGDDQGIKASDEVSNNERESHQSAD